MKETTQAGWGKKNLNTHWIWQDISIDLSRLWIQQQLYYIMLPKKIVI